MVSALAGFSAPGVFCSGQRLHRVCSLFPFPNVSTRREAACGQRAALRSRNKAWDAQGRGRCVRKETRMSDRHEMWGNLGMDLEACAEMANKLADGPGNGVLVAVRRLHRCAGVVYGPERRRRGSARFAHAAPGALRMRFCAAGGLRRSYAHRVAFRCARLDVSAHRRA